jgi:hypothetical protein
MNSSERGYTLSEVFILLFTLAVMICIMVGVMTAITGNFWITEPGVLKAIQLQDPNVVKVLNVERHAFYYSMVLVERKDGRRVLYVVDSNIFFNYTVAG